jgi:hypothetical protein
MFPFMLPFLPPQAMSLIFPFGSQQSSPFNALSNTPFNLPLSGNVTQDINPVTSWLSPQVEFNFAGKREVEADVVSNIASYGKQLGTIIPALLELAGDTQGAALDNLRTLEAKIESTKEKHRSQQVLKSQQELRKELELLKQKDPEALKALLSDFG